MYSNLLVIHSFTRWLLLVSLLYTLYRAFRGYLGNKPFSAWDSRVGHYTATIGLFQLFLGLWLYFISPVVDYFLQNYRTAVHLRSIRFFGMEHSLMMLIAVVLITIGSIKSKRKETDLQRFKTMAIWFGIALIIILVNVPWPFSPFAARPWGRGW